MATDISAYYQKPPEAYPVDLLQRAAAIRLLATDVDGVLTANEIMYTADGDEIKCYNAKDGHGLWMLAKTGVITAIITGRKSPVNERRAQELGVHHLFQGIKDKAAILDELLAQYGFSAHQVAFIGDDLPDLPVLRQVGLAACPEDAVYQVKAACHWITPLAGGKGAMRALADLVLFARSQQAVQTLS